MNFLWVGLAALLMYCSYLFSRLSLEACAKMARVAVWGSVSILPSWDSCRDYLAWFFSLAREGSYRIVFILFSSSV